MDSQLRFLKSEEGKFYGADIFYEYFEAGRLRPGQGFRIYKYTWSAGSEPRFCLGLEGKLYDQNQEEVDPGKVLDNLEGWEFNYMCLSCLPDAVVLKLPR